MFIDDRKIFLMGLCAVGMLSFSAAQAMNSKEETNSTKMKYNWVAFAGENGEYLDDKIYKDLTPFFVRYADFHSPDGKIIENPLKKDEAKKWKENFTKSKDEPSFVSIKPNTEYYAPLSHAWDLEWYHPGYIKGELNPQFTRKVTYKLSNNDWKQHVYKNLTPKDCCKEFKCTKEVFNKAQEVAIIKAAQQNIFPTKVTGCGKYSNMGLMEQNCPWKTYKEILREEISKLQ